jgi:hypothetical protein
MKIDELIVELQWFKAKYGNVDVVYWYEDKERTLSINDVMAVNTGTAVTPNWKCELTD